MADINYLTAIRFDFGAVNGLPEDLKALGITRPLTAEPLVIFRAGASNRCGAGPL